MAVVTLLQRCDQRRAVGQSTHTHSERERETDKTHTRREREKNTHTETHNTDAKKATSLLSPITARIWTGRRGASRAGPLCARGRRSTRAVSTKALGALPAPSQPRARPSSCPSSWLPGAEPHERACAEPHGRACGPPAAPGHSPPGRWGSRSCWGRRPVATACLGINAVLAAARINAVLRFA